MCKWGACRWGQWCFCPGELGLNALFCMGLLYSSSSILAEGQFSPWFWWFHNVARRFSNWNRVSLLALMFLKRAGDSPGSIRAGRDTQGPSLHLSQEQGNPGLPPWWQDQDVGPWCAWLNEANGWAGFVCVEYHWVGREMGILGSGWDLLEGVPSRSPWGWIRERSDQWCLRDIMGDVLLSVWYDDVFTK